MIKVDAEVLALFRQVTENIKFTTSDMIFEFTRTLTVYSSYHILITVFDHRIKAKCEIEIDDGDGTVWSFIVGEGRMIESVFEHAHQDKEKIRMEYLKLLLSEIHEELMGVLEQEKNLATAVVDTMENVLTIKRRENEDNQFQG
jgi:hypothetical protein